MPRTLLCLVNPASGKGRALRRARELLGFLKGRGWDAALEESQGPGWMARRAAEAQADVVVAAGGDGTVNGVAQGLAGREVPLAVLPAGTVNLLARNFGLPGCPEGLADLLDPGLGRWKEARLDVGTAGERVFLSCAGAGFDAHVVRRLHRERRGPIRLWSYLPHVAAAVASPPESRIRVRLDGADAGIFAQVIVGNLPLYAGILRFTPEARSDDGLLDVALFPGRRRRDLLRYAAAALRGGISPEGVLIRRAAEVRLESEGAPRGAPVQLDGDDAGDLPLTLGVRPGALRFVVP